MNKQSLGALIALNLVLLLALVLVGLTPQPASAEGFLRPQYLMISGTLPGRSEQAIYIVELVTARVETLIFHSGQGNGGGQFEVVVPPQGMSGDFENAGR